MSSDRESSQFVSLASSVLSTRQARPHNLDMKPITFMKGLGVQPGSPDAALIEDDKYQERFRNVLNEQIYTFDMEKNVRPADYLKYVMLLEQYFSKIDLSDHLELPSGSYQKGGKLPNGLIYDDINNVLFKLYQRAEFNQLGLDWKGLPNPALATEEVKATAAKTIAIICRHIQITSKNQSPGRQQSRQEEGSDDDQDSFVTDSDMRSYISSDRKVVPQKKQTA